MILLLVIKDLKIKGSSSVVKIGAKVKILRLVEGDHDIDCKIDGIGPMMFKSFCAWAVLQLVTSILGKRNSNLCKLRDTLKQVMSFSVVSKIPEA